MTYDGPAGRPGDRPDRWHERFRTGLAPCHLPQCCAAIVLVIITLGMQSAG